MPMIVQRKHYQEQKEERTIFMIKHGDSQSKKTFHESVKEFPDKTYKELEKKYEKEHKLRQEAEGELTIVKGISVHMSPEMRDAKKEIEDLKSNLDRTRKENNDLYNRIAELIEANEKEVKNLKWIKDHDYIFLIDENKKLHADIKKLKEAENQVEKARKAGM